MATNLNIAPTSVSHTLVIADWPKQTLNVLLYSDLPSAPNGNFAWMQALIATGFATYHPDVLLNAVLSQDEVYDIYTVSNLPKLYGAQGFDVVELDTILLGDVVPSAWIRPVTYDASAFWPAAVSDTTYSGQRYGVPSWLCSDYLYSRDPAIAQQTTLAQLLSYLQSQSSAVPRLIGDFNGHWRLVSLYLNAYVDLYGYAKVSDGLKLPLDPKALDSVAAVSGACAFQNTNNCVNGTYHGEPDGAISDVFATGGADTYVGFSEQSFYILSAQSKPSPLYAVQVPYGTQLQPMMFLDAFTVNASTCAAGSACDANATAFINYMNTSSTRMMIAYSWDLTAITEPPRHLLPAITSFYDQPLVKKDPLYTQYKQLIEASNAFPNTINTGLEMELYSAICAGLVTRNPQYKC